MSNTKNNKSELFQIRNYKKSWYNETIDYGCNLLIQKSIEIFGEVIPYIQYQIMYDIQWRLQKPVRRLLDDDAYSKYREKDLIDLYSRVKNGEKAESILSSKKYYKFYKEIFNAVLSGMLGEFEEKDSTGKKVKKYGLIACSPIAKGFAYSEYDDFGASRSYGYKRKHLGHDMLCETGTPIICIEDGIVECMGWNQYGGWRIGIRSKDKKRYFKR